MNTERKTPGQIAFETYHREQDSTGGIRLWNNQTVALQKIWERAAAEVLAHQWRSVEEAAHPGAYVIFRSTDGYCEKQLFSQLTQYHTHWMPIPTLPTPYPEEKEKAQEAFDKWFTQLAFLYPEDRIFASDLARKAWQAATARAKEGGKP